MLHLVLLLVVGLTSLAAYQLGRRWLGLPASGFREVANRTLESLGISMLFFTGNLLCGAVIAILIRTLTPFFFPLYVISDMVLLPLSLAQGLAFWWWRQMHHDARRREY